MNESKPKVLGDRGKAIDVDWHAVRPASEVSAKLPPPPWASMALSNGDDEWLFSQFRRLGKKSDTWVLGEGFDQTSVRIGGEQSDTPTLELINQSWMFFDFQSPEGRAAASEAIAIILRTYNFPTACEPGPDRSIAWAWHGETLCWASVPLGSRIEAAYPGDPIFSVAEASLCTTGTKFQKPARDTWSSVALSPQFTELLPPSAPIHWALAVASLVAALDTIEDVQFGAKSRDVILHALKASFDAGAKATEFQARRFSGRLEKLDRTETLQRRSGEISGERWTQEADGLWYSAAQTWLQENMPRLSELGVEKIYDAITADALEGKLHAAIPGYEQFRRKFLEWEDAGLFEPRKNKGKPGRPNKTRLRKS